MEEKRDPAVKACEGKRHCASIKWGSEGEKPTLRHTSPLYPLSFFGGREERGSDTRSCGKRHDHRQTAEGPPCPSSTGLGTDGDGIVISSSSERWDLPPTQG